MRPLLSVERLSVSFAQADSWVPTVREVSFEIEAGEFVGLVGESGSGKSVTALAVLRLLPATARIDSGRVELRGRDLITLPEEAMRQVRGGRIAMIFQEPMTALNPVFTIGFQITEAIRAHRRMDRRQARRRAARLLDLVAMPSASRRLQEYPHQLSGGQQQRVMIAMALAAEPELLVADEPTTALDVTVQAQILELLETLRGELGLAILLITHDLAVVAETCSRVLVLYAGQLVEQAAAAELYRTPAHPYTRGLLQAARRPGETLRDGRLPTIPGQVPDPRRLPQGCAFHPRCPEVLAICERQEPGLVRLAAAQEARCFLHQEASDVIEEPGA